VSENKKGEKTGFRQRGDCRQGQKKRKRESWCRQRKRGDGPHGGKREEKTEKKERKGEERKTLTLACLDFL
jgi:hypothetical protein